MRRKVALTAAAVAMVGTLAVGGTLAWFTDTETATNVVTTGNVDIAIHETDDPGKKFDETTIITNEGLSYGDETKGVTPGEHMTKRVAIQNTGKNPALIKVTIDVANNDVIDLVLAENSKWLSGGEGVYYYSEAVAPTAFTADLLSALEIAPTVDNKSTDLADLEVKIMAYAIQSENLKVGDDSHAVDPTSLDDMKAAFNDNTILDYTNENEVGNDGVDEEAAEGENEGESI